MIAKIHNVLFNGGVLRLELTDEPTAELLPDLITPLFKATEEISHALETERRDGKDEKGGDAGSPKEMGRDSERGAEKDRQ